MSFSALPVSPLFLFGLNHNTAPLAVREKLSLSREAAAEQAAALVRANWVEEALLLCTCNRTELYCVGEARRAHTAFGHFAQTIQIAPGAHTALITPIDPGAPAFAHRRAELPEAPARNRIPPDLRSLDAHLYRHGERAAVLHAFRVACGLDSMVLGETQILGQMKDAVRDARAAHALGGQLDTLFQRTFAVAKTVRFHTEIGANSVSLAAAAVRLAEQLFANIAPLRVLFIGAGEMIALCTAHFAACHPQQISVANRTRERAEALAQQYAGDGFALRELPERLAQYDIVVSCTASQLPILGLGTVSRAVRLRRHRPMLIVDLAVPRDIEAEVGDLDDVYLHSIDDLLSIVRTGQARRVEAAHKAENLIAQQVDDYMQQRARRTLAPLVCQLQAQAATQQQRTLAEAQHRLQRGEPVAEVLDGLARRLTRRLLHPPLTALGHAPAHELAALETATRQLFGLRELLPDTPSTKQRPGVIGDGPAEEN